MRVALEHIDFDKGALLIERSIVENGKGELVETDTKTHAARRLRLDPGTVDRLREHRIARLGLGTELGTILRPDDYVFSSDPAGQAPWRPGYVTLAFCRLRDHLGIYAHFVEAADADAANHLGTTIDAATTRAHYPS